MSFTRPFWFFWKGIHTCLIVSTCLQGSSAFMTNSLPFQTERPSSSPHTMVKAGPRMFCGSKYPLKEAMRKRLRNTHDGWRTASHNVLCQRDGGIAEQPGEGYCVHFINLSNGKKMWSPREAPSAYTRALRAPVYREQLGV
jgi:hypothetical protein